MVAVAAVVGRHRRPQGVAAVEEVQLAGPHCPRPAVAEVEAEAEVLLAGLQVALVAGLEPLPLLREEVHSAGFRRSHTSSALGCSQRCTLRTPTPRRPCLLCNQNW